MRVLGILSLAPTGVQREHSLDPKPDARLRNLEPWREGALEFEGMERKVHVPLQDHREGRG